MSLYTEVDDAAKEMYKDGYTGDLELHCGPWALVRMHGLLPPEAWRTGENSDFELMSSLGQRIVLVCDQSVPRDEWIMKGRLNILGEHDRRR